MKWVHEGKEYEIRFKYLRMKETKVEKKLREADEFAEMLKRMLKNLDSMFNTRVIVKPSDVNIDKYFKFHKFRGKVVGLVVTFEKDGNPGWSLVNLNHEPTDTFDFQKGLEIAFERSKEKFEPKKVPHIVRDAVKGFI